MGGREVAHHGSLGLEQFSHELLELIAAELSAVIDIGNFACVCRSFAHVVQSGHVWRAALMRAGGSPPAGGGCPRRSLRQLTMLDSPWWDCDSDGHFAPGGPCARTQMAAFACLGGQVLVVFGGAALHGNEPRFRSDCWALDLSTETHPSGSMPALRRQWYRVAEHEVGPSPRIVSAESAAGAVLRDARGAEFIVLHGGLLSEGHRDNETWLLGPIGPAHEASRWRWSKLSERRRCPPARFHHCLTVMGSERRGRRRQPALGGTALCISGGHDHMLRPLLGVHVLSLRAVDLCASAAFRDDAPQPDCGGTGGMAPARRARELPLNVQWQRDDSLSQLRSARAASKPAARAHHAAAAWGRYLVLCGGQLGLGACLSDTWLLDTVLGGWAQLPAHLPSGGRARAAATVSGDILLLCGGESPHPTLHGVSEHLADLWALNLGAPVHGWSRLSDQHTPSVPRPLGPRGLYVSASLAALHAGRTLLLFGGRSHRGSGPHLGEPLDSSNGPALTWAARLAVDGSGAARIVRSARCELDGHGARVVSRVRRGAQVCYTVCGDRLLACHPHETEDRLTVSMLTFTRAE